MYRWDLSSARGSIARRAIAVVCALAVGFVGSVAFESGDRAPAAATPPAVSDDQSASKRAATSGERVEILEKRTETAQTFANPDGTFTLEQSNVPVRTERDGQWLDLDPTLSTSADGRVRPAATSMEMSFSGGGTDPLITMESDGHEMKLSWPNSLPEPVVADDNVTYPNVFPDVDLKITASKSSYSEVLVVKTPQAARLPQLQQVDMELEAPGLTVAKVEGGAITAKDDFGKVVFAAPQPLMWDSRGEAEAPTDADRTEAPLEGDKVVQIPLTVTQDTLTFGSSAALVNDAAVEYPLHIDPPFTSVQWGRAMINQAYPSTASWLWGGPEGVGYQSFEPWSRKRLFFKMGIQGLAGTHITYAVFSAYSTWSGSCTKKEVQLWKTVSFGSGVNWNVGSGSNVWLKRLGSATDAVGRDGCTPNGKWIEFSALAAVSEQAAANSGYVYLGLRAADETDSMAWKRFRSDVKLSINYNHRPQVSGRRTISPSMGCSTVKEQPIIVNQLSPVPIVKILDEDAQNSRAEFEFWINGETSPKWGASSYDLDSGPNPDYSPRADVTGMVPNHLLAWRVRVFDGIDWSNWSSYCWFWVDTTKPPPPTTSVGGSEPRPLDRAIGVGFAPTSSDTTGFRYSIDTEEPTSGMLPLSSPTFSFFPAKPGPLVIRAWSYDRAGNRSTNPTSVRVTIETGDATGLWQMDEGFGTVLADGSGKSHNFNLGPTVTWAAGDRWDPTTTGPQDWSLTMPGDATAASAATNIIDTSRSFTVSARVRLGSKTGRQVAVSEDRPGTSGFMLGALSQDLTDPDDPKALWSFSIPDPDGSGEISAELLKPYVVGNWVYLTGVYDSVARQLTIYVDAESKENAEVSGKVTAADGVGPLRMGLGIGGGIPTYFLDGQIDDVRIYPGPIDLGTVKMDMADSNPTS
jgi:hypothetical protein